MFKPCFKNPPTCQCVRHQEKLNNNNSYHNVIPRESLWIVTGTKSDVQRIKVSFQLVQVLIIEEVFIDINVAGSSGGASAINYFLPSCSGQLHSSALVHTIVHAH